MTNLPDVTLRLDATRTAHLATMRESARDLVAYCEQRMAEPAGKRKGVTARKLERARADEALLDTLLSQVPAWAVDVPQWFVDQLAMDDNGSTWVRTADDQWSGVRHGHQEFRDDVEMLQAAGYYHEHPVAMRLRGVVVEDAGWEQVGDDGDDDVDQAGPFLEEDDHAVAEADEAPAEPEQDELPLADEAGIDHDDSAPAVEPVTMNPLLVRHPL